MRELSVQSEMDMQTDDCTWGESRNYGLSEKPSALG